MLNLLMSNREEVKLTGLEMPYDVFLELQKIVRDHEIKGIPELHQRYEELSTTTRIPAHYFLWLGMQQRDLLRKHPELRAAFCRDQTLYSEILRMPSFEGNFQVLTIEDVLISRIRDTTHETFTETTFVIGDVLGNQIQGVYLHGYKPSDRYNNRALRQIRRVRNAESMLTFDIEGIILPKRYRGKDYAATMLVFNISRNQEDGDKPSPTYSQNETPSPSGVESVLV